jgi:hypothetical protein
MNGSLQYDRLIRDLNEEKVAALRRISGTLESLIEQLQALGAGIPELAADERAQAISAYRELRRRALRYRWYLEVQREALGLFRHHRLDEFYAVPDELDQESGVRS